MSREKNYTKGPWEVLSSDNEDLFIEKHKILTVTSVKTSDVNFQIEVMDASDDTQKAEANANLISAAPELLEALEEAHESICFNCGKLKEENHIKFDCDNCTHGNARKSAIKKAYGETE